MKEVLLAQKSFLFDGKSHFYYEGGKGNTTLFLLHGFWENTNCWTYLLPYLSDFHFIIPDHSGMGMSPLVEPHSIDTVAKSMDYLIRSLNINNCVVIGHSMGGYIGASLAALQPDYLKGLCLLHSHPFEDSLEKKESRAKSIQFVRQNGVPPLAKTVVPSLFHPDFVQHPEIVKSFFEIASQLSSEAVISCTQAMIDRKDQSKAIAELSSRYLCIVGSHDATIPMDLSLKQASLNVQTEVHLLENVAHMGMVEQPEKVANILRQWVDELNL